MNPQDDLVEKRLIDRIREAGIAFDPAMMAGIADNIGLIANHRAKVMEAAEPG